MGIPAAEQLSQWTGGEWLPALPRCVAGFSIDTRALRPGEVFVALKTERRDGHDYLVQAQEHGASGAIVSCLVEGIDLPQLRVEDTYAALQLIGAQHRRSFTKPLVGITGSCGKTSTKDLLATLLGDDVLRTEGNLNNYLGLPLTLLRLHPGRHAGGVVELGISMAGEMAVLARIAMPDIAIVTMIAEAHLEGLGGSIENVAREKAMLPGVLAADKTAILPESCLRFEDFRKLRARTLVVTRKGGDSAVPASNYQRVLYSTEAGSGGATRMSLATPGCEPITVTLPRLSAGMAGNAALALTAAQLLGVNQHWLQVRIERWRPAAFRGELVQAGGVTYYVDCYNANPASMQDSVDAFRAAFPLQRRLYLLGCMNELGPRSPELHHELGRALRLGGGDSACVIGREAEVFRDGLIAGGMDPARVTATASLDDARAILDQFSTEGGAVLLKGSRGYRLELLLPDAALRGTSAREVQH